MENIELSIVIPCYNSEHSIEELMERIDQQLNKMGLSYEVICVNDCSKDKTINKFAQLSEKYPQFTGIDLMFNVGQFRALMCGFEQTSGQYIVTMDDDLQHPPEEIDKLYDTLKKNPDIDAVLGAPIKKAHAWYRNIGSFFVRKINEKIFNKPKELRISAFRCLNRKLVDTLVNHKTFFPVMGPLILRSTRNIINVDIEHNQRKYGTSNYTFVKLIKTTIDNIINFSSLPLKYISMLGMISAGISFLMIIYFLFKYFLIGISQPGWTSVVLLINFYSGMILLSLGVIGEYLVRVQAEVNGYPKYVIRKKIKSK